MNNLSVKKKNLSVPPEKGTALQDGKQNCSILPSATGAGLSELIGCKHCKL